MIGMAGDRPVVGDYDGDGRSDIAVFRQPTGEWWVNRSSAGVAVTTFGTPFDEPVPGAYTGDGRANIAFWRKQTGEWFVLRSLDDPSYYSFPWGVSTDVPAPADYDGDGKFDSAVFRPSTGLWYINRTSPPGPLVEPFGTAGDHPVPASHLYY